jgi:hypothetical protein
VIRALGEPNAPGSIDMPVVLPNHIAFNYRLLDFTKCPGLPDR